MQFLSLHQADILYFKYIIASVVILTKKINILYIIDYLHDQGGTERHLLYLLKLLSKERYNCIVVAFDTGTTKLTEEIKEIGVPLVHIPVGRYYTINAIKRAFDLRRIIIDNNIDIVQTFHFKSDFYGAIVARLSGVKNIVSSKRDIGDLKSSFHFFLNKLARGITKNYIVVAEAVGKIVVEREKVPQDKLKIIYNGVDLEKFSPPKLSEIAKSREKLSLSETDFVIGTVAWMRPEKNYDVLFAGFEQAAEKIKELKLVIVGGGPLLGLFKDYVREKGIGGQVFFSGPVNDVRLYLQALDVACLIPGSNEGFSNSIIEKMAMGLPLIVSDVGGNAEAVLDGYNGIVIPPNNPRLLSDAIYKLWQNLKMRKEMGSRSLKRVREKFTLEEMTKSHEELYESLVSAGNQ
ncbi:MAG: glycosyltransferase [Parachlamydiaceae bacterium]|nr:glycosyltransferase [Parachlamydiaceae bacterium]